MIVTDTSPLINNPLFKVNIQSKFVNHNQYNNLSENKDSGNTN